MWCPWLTFIHLAWYLICLICMLHLLHLTNMNMREMFHDIKTAWCRFFFTYTGHVWCGQNMNHRHDAHRKHLMHSMYWHHWLHHVLYDCMMIGQVVNYMTTPCITTSQIWNIWYIYIIFIWTIFLHQCEHIYDVYINIVLPRPTPAHILLYTIILSSVLSYKSSYISHDMSWYSYLYLLRVDPLLQKSWPVIQGLPHRMPQLFIYWIRVLRNLSPWYFITIAGNFRPKDHRFHLRLGSVRAQYYWKVPWFSTTNIT